MHAAPSRGKGVASALEKASRSAIDPRFIRETGQRHPLWPREKWSVLSSQEICLNMHNYLVNDKIPANEARQQQELPPHPNSKLLMFDSASDSYPISLSDYMKRIVHYTRTVCSPVVQVGAVLLIERLERAGCLLTTRNVYRVFAVAFFLAYKAMEDEPHLVNSKLSQIAGMPVAELVALETAFCKCIEFNLGMMHDLDIQQRIVDVLLPASEIGVDDAGTFYRQDLAQRLAIARTPSPWAISTPMALAARALTPRPPQPRPASPSTALLAMSSHDHVGARGGGGKGLRSGSCGTSTESLPPHIPSRESTPALLRPASTDDDPTRMESWPAAKPVVSPETAALLLLQGSVPAAPDGAATDDEC